MSRNSLFYSLALFLHCAIPFVGNAQWRLLNSGTTLPIRAIFFTDDTIGYAVGGQVNGQGIILKTIDSGATWTSTIAPYCLNSVHFPSKDTGYAVGEQNEILKTTNAGGSWSPQFSSLSSIYSLNCVFFTSNDTGYIAPINGSGLAFLKTVNGGITWINDTTLAYGAWAIHFPSSNVGYTVRNRLYRTIDAGSTWSANSVLPGNLYTSVFFISNNIGFASGSDINGTPCFNFGTVIKTNNGGFSWNNTTFPCEPMGTIFFPNTNFGFVLGGAGKVWKTTNSGLSWFPIVYDTVSSQTSGGMGLYCTDSATCYVSCNNGKIFKTIMGGGFEGIEESSSGRLISIYPNPTDNNVIVQMLLTETQDVSLDLSNVLGELVYSIVVKNQSGNFQQQLDLSDFSNGIFLLRIRTADDLISRKIIKQ
jgi:photosystem II stability/assembly factor-like uncharacterized protein